MTVFSIDQKRFEFGVGDMVHVLVMWCIIKKKYGVVINDGVDMNKCQHGFQRRFRINLSSFFWALEFS